MQYHAILCNTMQYHAILCNTMQYHAIPCIINSVRSSYSHPDLLLITTPLFQITPVLNTGLSLSEPLQQAYWHTLAYSGILWHTLAYSGILWH